MNYTILDLETHVRALVAPLATGTFVADWEERARAVSAISDYLCLKLRDDAFVSDAADEPAECESDSGLRRAMAASMHEIAFASPRRLPLSVEPESVAADVLRELCATLDGSEKIVISAAAHALVHIPMSTELFSAVSNLLFEEAYHLRIIGDLLQLDHASRQWLTDDKKTNWELVTRCRDEYSYMLVEHVLFEGRGGLAAAKGTHTARSRGVSETTCAWLEKICYQETNHGIVGFVWLDRLRRPDSLSPTSKQLIREFIERECDDRSGGFRTVRQRYSAWLLEQHYAGAPISQTVQELKDSVRRCLSTGEIPRSADELSASVDRLYARCA